MDILERLRSPATVFYEHKVDDGALYKDAADEIEKLTVERDAYKSALDEAHEMTSEAQRQAFEAQALAFLMRDPLQECFTRMGCTMPGYEKARQALAADAGKAASDLLGTAARVGPQILEWEQGDGMPEDVSALIKAALAYRKEGRDDATD